jgi:hypothetical protein
MRFRYRFFLVRINHYRFFVERFMGIWLEDYFFWSSSSRMGQIWYQISFLVSPIPDGVARPPRFCLAGQGSPLRITLKKTAPGPPQE